MSEGEITAGGGGVPARPLGDNPTPDTQGSQFDADLANIDFGDILGGPLTAAINAQAQAAMVTANFIQNVGLEPSSSGGGGGGGGTTAPSQKVRTVEFDYSRTTVDPKTGTTSTSNESLTVPLLSIVPIPYLRVQQLSVQLQVKLNSISKSDSSSSVTSTTNTSAGGGGFFDFFSPVKFNCTVTTQNSSSSSQEVDENYNLDVKMLAVQDEMPAGLSKVLGILETLIAPTPKAAST